MLHWGADQGRVAVMSGNLAVILDSLRASRQVAPCQGLCFLSTTSTWGGGRRRKRARWLPPQSRTIPCTFLPFHSPNIAGPLIMRPQQTKQLSCAGKFHRYSSQRYFTSPKVSAMRSRSTYRLLEIARATTGACKMNAQQKGCCFDKDLCHIRCRTV